VTIGGVSDTYTVTTGSSGAITFDQHFTATVDFSTNTYVGSIVGGGATLVQTNTSPGYITFNSDPSSYSSVYLKSATNLSTVQTTEVTAKGAEDMILYAEYFSGTPTHTTSSKISPLGISLSGNSVLFTYADTGGTTNYFDGSVWTTYPYGNVSATVSDGAGSYYVYRINTNGTTVTISVYESNGSTLIKSATIAVSSLYNPGGQSLYILTGENRDDGTYNSNFIVDRIRVY
jgi:hypothetical protein